MKILSIIVLLYAHSFLHSVGLEFYPVDSQAFAKKNVEQMHSIPPNLPPIIVVVHKNTTPPYGSRKGHYKSHKAWLNRPIIYLTTNEYKSFKNGIQQLQCSNYKLITN